MARTQNKLTALQIKKLKADPQKSIKIGDGGNLYFRIDPNGSRYWIFNYTRPYTSKRNEMSLGTYPEMSLEEARKVRDEYKVLIQKGIDPAAQRLQHKHQRKHELDHTFQVIAGKWLEKRAVEKKEDSETIRRLNHDVLPFIANLTFDQLTLEVLEDRVFQPILERKAYAVERLKSDLNQIFKFARKRKLITYNPIEDIELPSPPKKNHAAIVEPRELALLVKAVWGYGELHPRSLITTQISIKKSPTNPVRFSITQTNKSEYAHELELANGQIIYVKRLKDSRPSKKWVSRLMIHPELEKYRNTLKIERVDLNFNIEDNMSTAYKTFPVSPLSKAEITPSRYGIGVNFRTTQTLEEFVKILSSI